MRAFVLSSLLLLLSLEAREINLDKLIHKATLSHKHLFVFLHKTHCGYCENMKEFTLQNETIHSFINKNFIYEHINVSMNDTVIYQDFHGTAKEFANEIGYDFYPTALFFDVEGELVFAEVGYRDSKKESNEKRFYKILHYINSQAYKNNHITDYKFITNKEL